MNDRRFLDMEVWATTLILLAITCGSILLIEHTAPGLVPGLTGQVPTTVNVTAQATDQFCNFYLLDGWNLVSFYCLSNYPNTTTAMAPINSSFYAVFAYDPEDGNNSWNVYNPSLPSWVVQDLEQMDRLHGYWIYMNQSATYIYNGTIVRQTIPLVKGWNLAGYPSQTADDAETSFGTINGSYTRVYIYNATTDSIQIFIPGDPANSTFNLTLPNYGYWINTTEDIDWTLP